MVLTISGVKHLEKRVHFIDSRNQVIGRNIANKVRQEIDCVVAAVENRVHDAILTPMDSVVKARVEMAVKFMTGLSERGRHSVVRNPYHRDFSGNMEIRPLMAASSRMDSIINPDRNDEAIVKTSRTPKCRREIELCAANAHSSKIFFSNLSTVVPL